MDINLVELWAAMGLPVRAVVVLLTLQATACVAVVIDRLVLLGASGGRARSVAESLEAALNARDYERALSATQSGKPSHLGSYLGAGLRTFVDRKRAGDR